jgi:hypothetical protein
MSLRIRENAINSPFPNEWPKSRPLPETSRKYNRPKRCTFFELEGELCPMEPILIGGLMELYQNLSMDGFRVLAVACKDLKTREAYSKDDESELIPKGYVAFLDPQYSPLCRIAGFHTFARPVARTTTLGKPLPIDGVSDLDRSLYSGTKPNNQERCEIWTMKSL